MKKFAFLHCIRPVVMNRRASVLIFALWVLAVLGIFAAHIGLRVRQRITFLSRIETRAQLHHMARAGVQKGIAALKQDIKRNQDVYTAYGKMYRHNNPAMFRAVVLGGGRFHIRYNHTDHLHRYQDVRYGIVDEESKININRADRQTMARLFQKILQGDDDFFEELADAIIEWREFGLTRLEGFSSDSYYLSLPQPYEPKGDPFERIDELLLVKGVTPAIFAELEAYVTVFGDGLVNVNTASLPVLTALGLDDVVAEKLILARRGLDEQEATADDFIFLKPYDLAIEARNLIKLEDAEFRQIDDLNRLNKIKVNAQYYRIESEAFFEEDGERRRIIAVFNVQENMVEYWWEK